MRIKTLSIRNFRSIQRLDLELPNVCALIGPNNAGKSNILEAIRRVLAPDWNPRVTDFDEEDVFTRDPSLDIAISTTFDTPIPYAKIKDSKPAEVSTLSFSYTRYQIGENKGQRRLEQTCTGSDGKVPVVLASRLKKGQQAKYEPVLGIPADVRRQVPLIYIGTNRSLREQLPSARYSLLRRMFEDVNRQLQDPSSTVKVERTDGTSVDVPRLHRFHFLMKMAMNLLRTDEFKKVEEAIKRNALEHLGMRADDDVDFYFTPMDAMDFYKSLDLIVREGNLSISASDMGEGMQNAIVLAILRAFEETQKQGAILLIEEPEMFLHPHMQRSLYSTLRRIGETNQVIYTTHSPHFIAVPDYRDVILVRKDTARKTYVTRSVLPDATWRREKLRQSLDRERSEFFFANRILLVEGDTEKLSLPEFSRKLEIDIDRSGGTIIEVSGKKNLFDYGELAISFGIPTGIMYDKDSSDFAGKNKERDEAAYNAKLDALAREDKSVCIWCLDKDYESCVRSQIGETRYQELLQRYPVDEYGRGKPRRQRMVAADADMPVPQVFVDVLRWLSGTEPASEAPAQEGDELPF